MGTLTGPFCKRHPGREAGPQSHGSRTLVRDRQATRRSGAGAGYPLPTQQMRSVAPRLLALGALLLVSACGEHAVPTATAPTAASRALVLPDRPADRAALSGWEATRHRSVVGAGAVLYTFDELPYSCYWDTAPLTYRDLTFSGAIAVCNGANGKALIPANSSGRTFNRTVRYTNVAVLPAPASEVSISYLTYGTRGSSLVAYGPTGAEIARATEQGVSGVLTVRGDIRSIGFDTYQASIYLDDLLVTYGVSDHTAPVIVPTVSGTQGTNGWYTDDVTVSWQATDDESVITSAPCAATTISTATAGTVVSCTATSAGGTATGSVTVKLDDAPPTVTFTGATAYSVDQTVSLACTAADAMSGVASDACAPITGEGYDFPLGSSTVTRTAVDNAGNEGSGSVTFTVTASASSVCTLVERWVGNAGLANSLCVKLAKGNYAAFRNELSAQSGKHLTASHAAILARLSTAL